MLRHIPEGVTKRAKERARERGTTLDAVLLRFLETYSGSFPKGETPQWLCDHRGMQYGIDRDVRRCEECGYELPVNRSTDETSRDAASAKATTRVNEGHPDALPSSAEPLSTQPVDRNLAGSLFPDPQESR